MLHDVLANIVQDLLRVPVDPVRQPVDPVRTRMTGLLGRRPAVLPLQRSYQPSHIGQRRLTRLRPDETVHEPLVQSLQFTRPRPGINQNPAHDQTNELPAKPSRQGPLQY